MQKETENQKGIELRLLLSALWKKLWLIALVMALCGAVSVVITWFFVTPQYRSTAMFYVNINVMPGREDQSGVAGEDSTSTNGEDAPSEEGKVTIDSASISTSRSLVETYNVILKTRETMQEVVLLSEVPYHPADLIDMVNITSVGETEVFQVTVTGTQPQMVWRIAQGICVVLPQRITQIVEGTRVHVLEEPLCSTSPSSPSFSLNCLIGMYIGFLLTSGTLIALEFLRIHISAEEEIARYTDAPVLVSIPDMNASGSENYYGYVSRMQHALLSGKGKKPLVGKDISFEASEAYKLLRTKLGFSATEEKPCQVIGITSSVASEGKSLTAVNLAYTMSQLGLRVLLVDGDLRRPSVGVKLPVIKSPGLSEVLTRQSTLDRVVQNCGLPEEEKAFWVIAAGRSVPNPAELLSSKIFARLIKQLRRQYDYVIIDLPPAGVVSDPLSVSEWLDGVLLVVRQNHCRCRVLRSVIEQMRFMNCRLLGVVYNCASGHTRKTHYKKVYGRSSRGYSGIFLADELKYRKNN